MGDLTLLPGEAVHERSAHVLAVDLGQASDSTALCLMEHRVTDVVVERGPRHRIGAHRRAGELFAVRALRRLPLRLSYVAQVEEVGRALARAPAGTELVIDQTGVGRAVGDLFAAAGMDPVRVTITAGEGQSAHGSRRWSVSKGLLVSALDARLATGELKFAAGAADAEALQRELLEFRRKVSAAGRFSFEARVGQHDDLVLATAIALWHHATRPRPPVAAVGVYGVGAANDRHHPLVPQGGTPT